ncbi:MAG TPA: hypothetical protein DC024_01695 [Clostridiales bacterium]|jgi:hypothetical protein|nr:hypothetical protein [Clostridiales bacterium]
MTAEQVTMYWIGRIATDAFVSLAILSFCNYLYGKYRKCREKHFHTQQMEQRAKARRRRGFIDIMERKDA